MLKKIDFHTHSIVSHDGGITGQQYQAAVSTELLDCIAITDHGRIDKALELQQKMGKAIIVGEEIMTQSGELIGLYLSEQIVPGLTLEQTIKAIKQQNGVVYVPHPFERARHGIPLSEMIKYHKQIDIVEVFNARGWGRGKSFQAQLFASQYKVAGAASSDAHGMHGLGSAYTVLDELPTRDTIVEQLQTAQLQTRYAPLRAYMDPSINRLRKRFNKQT